MKKNGVKHIRVAPYHPASNGAVERLVQTFKQAMRAVTDNGLSSQHNLNNFLMTYRTTPHSTTGKTPSQLFLGRRILTRFSLLMPDVASGARDHQAEQKKHHDVRARERELPLGSTVTYKDSKNPSQWLPGVVVKQRGPVSYLVKLNTGQVWRKHVDQIRQVGNDSSESEIATSPVISQEPTSSLSGISGPVDGMRTNVTDTSSRENTAVEVRRYPLRERRPVDKLTY